LQEKKARQEKVRKIQATLRDSNREHSASA